VKTVVGVGACVVGVGAAVVGGAVTTGAVAGAAVGGGEIGVVSPTGAGVTFADAVVPGVHADAGIVAVGGTVPSGAGGAVVVGARDVIRRTGRARRCAIGMVVAGGGGAVATTADGDATAGVAFDASTPTIPQNDDALIPATTTRLSAAG
jgi:hypothetical protein